MGSVLELVRILFLIAVPALPCALLGAAAGGVKGALWGAGTGLAYGLFLALTADTRIARIYQVRRAGEPALIHSLHRALAAASGRVTLARLPAVRISPRPEPFILITRGLLDLKGLIVVSEGFLQRQSEDDLRASLLDAAMTLNAPGCRARTIAASMATVLWRTFAPGPARAFLDGQRVQDGLGPFTSLFFVILFPVGSLLLRLGGEPRRAAQGDDWRKKNLKVQGWLGYRGQMAGTAALHL